MKPKTTKPPVQTVNDQPDVPRRYRRTDLGTVPSDWQSTEIDRLLFTLRNGAVYEPVNNDGVPITRIETISDGRIDMSHTGRARYTDELTSYKMEQGDILYSHINSLKHIGKVAFFAGGVNLYHGMNLLLLRPKENVSALWLFYLLNSEPARRWARSIAKQAVNQASINTRELKRLYVPVPPSEEQRAIAEALSDVDGLLAALEKLIAKKRAIKQAAMQQLLTGKTRLPGFSGEWEELELKDLALITMGQSPQSKFYNLRGDGLPLIQGNADIDNRRTIERVWTTQASKTCDAGDLLLTVRAPVGAVGIALKDSCLGRGVCGLKPFGDTDFLYHALVYAEPRWKVFEQGSTFTAANSKQVGQFIVNSPKDPDEQTAIAAVLSDMDAAIAALERRRDKTQQIKQGMMQQLLTGRVRLVDVEEKK